MEEAEMKEKNVWQRK